MARVMEGSRMLPEHTSPFSPSMDHLNGWIFSLSYFLIYLAAAVSYVGVVQTTLCSKLGASATISNLPGAGYQLGQFAPLVVDWLLPHRLQREVVVWGHIIATFLVAAVAGAL